MSVDVRPSLNQPAPLPVPNPYDPDVDLDAVIINYRTPALLERCLHSWAEHDAAHRAAGVRVRLTVVDVDPRPGANASLDLSGVQALTLPWNAGYSGACNRAAVLTTAPLLSFWNADTRLTNPDAIPRMIAFFAEHPEDGDDPAHIAGPLSIDDQQRITHGGILGTLQAPQQRGWLEPVDDFYRRDERAVSVSGSAYFIRRTTWDHLTACPLFQEHIDPGNPGAMLRTPHYFEETFVSYHAWSHQRRVWYVGTAEVEHLWNKAPHDDVADTRQLFAASQPIFRRACDQHRIPHD